MTNETRQFITGFIAGVLATLVALFVLADIFLNNGSPAVMRVPILVAAFDIREGDTIQAVHLRSKHIDKRVYHPSMVVAGEENNCLGQVALVDIGVGSPIFRGTLKPPPADGESATKSESNED